MMNERHLTSSASFPLYCYVTMTGARTTITERDHNDSTVFSFTQKSSLLSSLWAQNRSPNEIIINSVWSGVKFKKGLIPNTYLTLPSLQDLNARTLF